MYKILSVCSPTNLLCVLYPRTLLRNGQRNMNELQFSNFLHLTDNRLDDIETVKGLSCRLEQIFLVSNHLCNILEKYVPLG